MVREIDLHNNKLVRTEELEIIYNGPSFDGKMEVPHLISQLKATENIINQIISELYKERKLENPNEIKLYLKLKRGSFQEIISIVFNHPLTIAIVGGCVVALFEKVLKRKEKNECKSINIVNLAQNITVVNNISQVVYPLQNKDDKIIVCSPSDPKIKTEISSSDKQIIKDLLKELQEEIIVEIYEEEHFGYLNMVNIDRVSYGFNLEGTNKHIPVTFRNRPNLNDIRQILGERVKIRAKSTYRNKELAKLEIISYEKKDRKILTDYFGDEDAND